jgi:hypothetical protein
MSLLIFQHYPTQVAIFTDTLATTPKGEALMFCNKSFNYPDLHMTMAVTGILQFGDRWNSNINVGMVAEDIDMLDAHTPQQLRQIWQELSRENGGAIPGTSTIYHFGWSNQLKQFVRYVYRSEKGFQSEYYPDVGIGVKPQPKETEGFVPPETVDAVIAVAERLREEQRQEPASSRIYIGGEIVLTLMQEQATVITTVHRFDDYASDWESMNSRLSVASMFTAGNG